MHNIENLINKMLVKSEQLEEEIKLQSDLKNLTVKQLYCIEVINELHNPSLSEIAKALNITKASTSVMIDRLSEHDYIVKVKSDKDKRSAHVHLTQKGKEAAKLHTKVHTEFAHLLTKNLTDSEKDILVVLLNKAVKSL